MLSQGIETRMIPGSELLPFLQNVKGFQGLKAEDLQCIDEVQMMQVAQGQNVYNQGPYELSFWLLIEGQLQIFKEEGDGSRSLIATLGSGESFGEVPLLSGAQSIMATCHAVEDSTLIRMENESFWHLLGTCPTVRRTILQNMSHRSGAYNALQLQREKLVSLGMLAAGLMHELNNPGSAAKRAAAQLRESLQTLPEVCLRLSQISLNAQQVECMRYLQNEVMAHTKPKPASSLEESDAEEELAQWLEELGMQDAWKLASTLISAGWRRKDMECTQGTFQDETLAETLRWLQGFIDSMQAVSTIEESLSRVTDLVLAVKRYAYEDKSTLHEVNVHDGIASTLTILGHKLRHKQLQVEKFFHSDLPKVKTCGRGLNQVWTNLLDNAIDAAPEGSTLTVRTWGEPGLVCVSIADQGLGIPEQEQKHIFEPFYTTKPVGVGTGLGLDIAHRIVTGQYQGNISFVSRPGSTEFTVRLPVVSAD